MDWNSIVTIVASLAGVIIGGLITYLTQARIARLQLLRETQLKKEAMDTERLELYGELLKLDGEYLMIYSLGGRNLGFESEIYTEKFRPIIYSKLYLLDKSFINKIRELDLIGLEYEFSGDIEDGNLKVIKLYKEIINDIENYISSYKF